MNFRAQWPPSAQERLDGEWEGALALQFQSQRQSLKASPSRPEDTPKPGAWEKGQKICPASSDDISHTSDFHVNSNGALPENRWPVLDWSLASSTQVMT